MRTFRLGIMAVGFCFTVALGAESAGIPAAREEDKPKVSVVSLMVLREVDAQAMSALLDTHGVGEYKTGVMVVGRVSMPAGDIVSADKALRVEKFADDKGTDLGNGTVKARFGMEEGIQCYMAPDHKQCTFWLGSATLPAAGAEKLLVEGSMNVQMGVGEKAAESKKLPLKLGQEYEVGELRFKVEEISTEGREGAFHVVFSSQGELGLIKAIECTDEAGQAVAVEMQDRYGGRGQSALGIELLRPVKEMVLRVVRYEKMEHVKVPVKVEVKVGL